MFWEALGGSWAGSQVLLEGMGIKLALEGDMGSILEPCWRPWECQWEAKTDKNRTKIALKFDADYGMHFGT